MGGLRKRCIARTLITVYVGLLFPPLASALSEVECDAIRAKIDERIAASAGHQFAAAAMQMRDSIAQSCSMLDHSTADQMLLGIERMLPVGDAQTMPPEQSAAERRLEREAQRSEVKRRQAQRAERRAAARKKEEAEQALVSNVLRGQPQGRATRAQAMDREDRMWGVSLLDRDLFRGHARVLYQTRPSRTQMFADDAAYHFYVVTFDDQDRLAQQHVFQVPSDRLISAALLPGKDEIVVQWHKGGARDSSTRLERWSISSAKRLSSANAPQLPAPGSSPEQDQFKLVTGSGELLYVKTIPLTSGPNPQSGVVWLLSSPNGEVTKQGRIQRDGESVSALESYLGANGRAGIVLDVRGLGKEGIDSRLQIDPVQIGETKVVSAVMSEKRLYEVGNADSGASLPAVDRQHFWLNLENVDQALMISGESTRITKEAERGKRLDDTLIITNAALRHRTALAPSRGGIGLLVRNNQDDDVFPPTRGLWLREYGPGDEQRDKYLELDASYLKTTLRFLSSDGSDGLYVGGDSAVLHLDKKRNVTAFARTSDANRKITAMIANGESVWLFGEALGQSRDKQQVWVERVQF